MESIELLSDVLIEILKEFSIEKRKLTARSLREALMARAELAFLRAEQAAAAGYPQAAPGGPAVLQKSPAGGNGSANGDRSTVSALQNTYLRIASDLAPLSRGECVEKLECLLQKVKGCGTIEELTAAGEELVSITYKLASRVADEVQYANDFLAELGKDLVGMERQLSSYQDHSRETYSLADKFCNNLLSHTEEMNRAMDRDFDGAGSLIASKLTAIGKAIALKRQEDHVRLQEADSKIAELQMSVHNYNEEITQVTERANALQKEALIDPLTEIQNRRAYEFEILNSIRRLHRDGQTFSLLLIDVDRFKVVNDLYGHRAGDKCLQEIVKRIKASLRKADFLARYGGEELVAILYGAVAEDAGRVAEKIRCRIEQTRFCYMNEEIPVTVSIGVTEVHPSDTDAEAPFIRVDEAMYRAKRAGRNRVCVIKGGTGQDISAVGEAGEARN